MVDAQCEDAMSAHKTVKGYKRTSVVSTTPLLDHGALLRALYVTLVDATPVVGTYAMASELQRLIDGGRPVGGLQGTAVHRG
jgi:hypothetical protein